MPRASSLSIYQVLQLLLLMLAASCSTNQSETIYDFEVVFKNNTTHGKMVILNQDKNPEIILSSIGFNTNKVKDLKIEGDKLTGTVGIWGEEYILEGEFTEDTFQGLFSRKENAYDFRASKRMDQAINVDRSQIEYMLSSSDLPKSEKSIDHHTLISGWDNKSFKSGSRIYSANCINCHGNPEIEGSIPLSTKFWSQPLKAGSDPFSMYETITRGFGSMPPQVTLTPREKYDVIHYIQEEFLRNHNEDEHFLSSSTYLSSLPKGRSLGPETKPYHPWSDMDYGNFFINTYELVDEETGPERYHSPGPSPFPDEDYSKNNFAYKGIAMRLDAGDGGITAGKAWTIFDHDLMRIAGGWSGDGFIDWNAILLNDRHETYPRTVGKLHFETPVGPAWANPKTGSFEDPRFTARDGRQFGPLPKEWADYKGLYHHENSIVVSYNIGNANILEKNGIEMSDSNIVFTRNLNISPSKTVLKTRIAPLSAQVAVKGRGTTHNHEDGFHILELEANNALNVKIFIANSECENFEQLVEQSEKPEDLKLYTTGGKSHYPEVITSPITKGNDNGPFAIDVLTPPFKNPWNARMKLSGIDFMKDSNIAVACATDGDVWKIKGLTDGSENLSWQRIGSGLFQPLGIKVLNEEIYVTCRDQLVRLQDLNGDGETDYYESFNHDHQVTDHFHEFAMGLQTDEQGNFYYAKSGRHAREALIPQHGTLMKVNADGSDSKIVATGFRAANGVCINPDGSFIVTDQQGYWNPMNRINWVEVDREAKFYGNMWGYDPPPDSSRNAMEQPLIWVDMEFDRSPSELLWADSEKWGKLDKQLLSFSYGYGKIQLVLQEEVNGQRQGGVIDLPGIKFLTGVMRGRFNEGDGNLYACGMSAWGTSQLMWGGGLYRVRATDKKLSVPIDLKAKESGIELSFAHELDVASAEDLSNYQIETWGLKRSKKYGSDRYDKKELKVTKVQVLNRGMTVKLFVDDMAVCDGMKITYDLKDVEGFEIAGKVQNTIHQLGKDLAI